MCCFDSSLELRCLPVLVGVNEFLTRHYSHLRSAILPEMISLEIIPIPNAWEGIWVWWILQKGQASPPCFKAGTTQKNLLSSRALHWNLSLHCNCITVQPMPVVLLPSSFIVSSSNQPLDLKSQEFISQDPNLWQHLLKMLFSRKFPREPGLFLMVQWLRICLPSQGMRVQSLIEELRCNMPCSN